MRLTPFDVFRASIAVGGRKFGPAWAILVVGSLVATLALVRYTASNSPSSEEDITRIMQNLLPLLFLVFSFPILFVIASYLSALSKVRHNPNLRGELRYSFSDEGIRTEGPTTRGEMDWSGLHRVEETRHAFLLFHDKGSAQVIAKKCFASTDDVSVLREIIRRNVQKFRLRS